MSGPSHWLQPPAHRRRKTAHDQIHRFLRHIGNVAALNRGKRDFAVKPGFAPCDSHGPSGDHSALLRRFCPSTILCHPKVRERRKPSIWRSVGALSLTVAM